MPHSPALSRRTLFAGLLACSIALPLQAQETAVKFQLDWRFEGPAALFLVPAAKGYFKAENCLLYTSPSPRD